jgi:hypothetical protein
MEMNKEMKKLKKVVTDDQINVKEGEEMGIQMRRHGLCNYRPRYL